jgi:TolB protein
MPLSRIQSRAQVPMSGGTPQWLAASGSEVQYPTFSRHGNRLAWRQNTDNTDIFRVDLKGSEKLPGSLPGLIASTANEVSPRYSPDGKKIAWETSRGGNFDVWVKDLVSGHEQRLTSGPLREHMPAMSRDGSRLMYDAHDGEKVTLFQIPFDGGAPAKVWEENTGQGIFQWTKQADTVLFFHREPPGTVGLMNLATRKRTVLLRHPRINLSLADARLSPDGRWIAFPVPLDAHHSRLAVARLSGKVIEDERDWSYLTPESFNAWQPEWSPNGRWLYFLSDQSGRLAVWALPLSGDVQPRGASKLILDLASDRLSVARMRPRDIGLSVARDKLALAMTEYSETPAGLGAVSGKTR